MAGSIIPPSMPAGSQVSSSDLEDLMNKQVDCTEQAWRFWYLLWCITSSGILLHHLEFLAVANWLKFPLRPNALDAGVGINYTEEDKKYAKTMNIYLQEKRACNVHKMVL
jgi:hypothetical protein